MGAPPGSTPAPAAPPPTVVSGGRLSALDGLRALAVLGVLFYHGGVGGVQGGMFGVDTFFVLSGFLITSLLLGERARTGTIRLGQFWARRARRLLPALLVTIVGALALARWGGGDVLSRVRGDAIGALLYVSNWHLVLSGQSYFVRYGDPSPLLHTWSLGVEEQFYLVWPLLVLAVVSFARRPARAVGWVAGIGALASAGLMAGLDAAGVSPSRLYYGSDTRAQALLAGAALAGFLANRSFAAGRKGWDLAGGLAAVGLGWMAFRVNGSAGWLYHGGFLLVAVLAAALLAAAVQHPEGLLARGLSARPLVAIGRISYGIYLYHWPIFLWLDGSRTGLTEWSLFAVRLAVTLAVSTASWVLLEQPVRRCTFRVPRITVPAALGTVAAVAVAMLPSAPTASASFSSADVPPGSIPAGAQSLAAQSATPTAAPQPAGPGTPPVRALLVGDSLGVTLGQGLSVDAARWGVTLQQGATVGCDLDPNTTVNIMGTVGPASKTCAGWQHIWPTVVARDRPQVVLVMLGRWETIDRIYDGRWTHIGQQPWDDHLRDELDQAIDILSARGATVVLLTLPYVQQTSEQPNGQPWDMNLPARTDAFNAVLAAAAARRPGKAVVINLNRIVDPAGHYTSYIDGVRVRNPDDEHFSVAGGEWLRPRLLPQVAAIGRASQSHGDANPHQ